MMKEAANRLTCFAAIAVLAGIGPALSQTPAPRRKALTPEQVQFQADTAQWRAQRDALRAQAQAALSAEMAREEAGDCPHADSTRAAEECLAAEIEKTRSNYAAFAGAIRAMLALPYPAMPGQPPFNGPTGAPPTPNELVAEFDQLEAESQRYREDAAKAAYNQFKGGTAAPVFALEADQRLLRLHLREFAFVYGEELSNH
jgi:hypothetical protein